MKNTKISATIEVNAELREAFEQFMINMKNGFYDEGDLKYADEVLVDIQRKQPCDWGKFTRIELTSFLLFRAGFGCSAGEHFSYWEKNEK